MSNLGIRYIIPIAVFIENYFNISYYIMYAIH